MEHGAVQEDSEKENRKDKLELAGMIGGWIVERMREDARNLVRSTSALDVRRRGQCGTCSLERRDPVEISRQRTMRAVI